MKRRPVRADPYHKLREAIVSGQLHPNERLVEAAIAERIGAGRTAVRAALVRLDQEGLVELERNRGARVRHISDGEALELDALLGAVIEIADWRGVAVPSLRTLYGLAKLAEAVALRGD